MRVGAFNPSPVCPGPVVGYVAADHDTDYQASRYVIPTLSASGKRVYLRVPLETTLEEWESLLGFASPYCPWFEVGNEIVNWNWRRIFAKARAVRERFPLVGRQNKLVLGAATALDTDRYIKAANTDGVSQLVDAIAVHPYSPTVNGALRILEDARERVPDVTEVVVSEVGWSLDPGRSTGYGATLVAQSEEDQADKVAGFLHGAGGSTNLVLIFAAGDYNVPTLLRRWMHTCGVHDLEGQRRDVYDVLMSYA